MQAEDQHTEEWRPVVGYEGAYEVSSLGRVRSLDRVIQRRGQGAMRIKGRLLRPATNWALPYPSVQLSGGARHYVHELVATAFHGPRPEQSWECRHLNGDPVDNRRENLAWGTSSENSYDIVRHGRNRNANKRFCKRGHPFTPANTRIRVKSDGKEARVCKECHNLNNRESKARKRDRMARV